MRRVVIESPWAGDIRKHRRYARKALKHSLFQGEAPLASHLLYTQVLNDGEKHERRLGIDAGLAWGHYAEAAIFYADYGFSPGMLHALQQYSLTGVPVEIRYLFKPRRGQRLDLRGKGERSDAPRQNAPSAIDTAK